MSASRPASAVHQRRLAGAGRAHDRRELARRRKSTVDPVEGPDLGVAPAVHLWLHGRAAGMGAGRRLPELRPFENCSRQCSLLISGPAGPCRHVPGRHAAIDARSRRPMGAPRSASMRMIIRVASGRRTPRDVTLGYRRDRCCASRIRYGDHVNAMAPLQRHPTVVCHAQPVGGRQPHHGDLPPCPPQAGVNSRCSEPMGAIRPLVYRARGHLAADVASAGAAPGIHRDVDGGRVPEARSGTTKGSSPSSSTPWRSTSRRRVTSARLRSPVRSCSWPSSCCSRSATQASTPATSP